MPNARLRLLGIVYRMEVGSRDRDLLRLRASLEICELRHGVEEGFTTGGISCPVDRDVQKSVVARKHDLLWRRSLTYRTGFLVLLVYARVEVCTLIASHSLTHLTLRATPTPSSAPLACVPSSRATPSSRARTPPPRTDVEQLTAHRSSTASSASIPSRAPTPRTR